MTIIRKSAALFACVCLLLALMSGCGSSQSSPEETKPVTNTYSITVQTSAGTPVQGLQVCVYEDVALSELVCVDKTDEKGTLAFRDTTCEGYVAVIKDLPAGYDRKESYPLTGESTVIVLEQRAMTDADMDDVKYALGDQVMDFTVTDCNGTEYTLSKLLEEKKALVLNFWFINCGPCKMEFPYVQEAYNQFSDRIELLAMNPVDGDDDSVRAFATENGLTFPMFSCDSRWQDMMKITAYPTTVIIDREGRICLIHKGMFTDSSALIRALEYFTADDYEQKVFDSIEEIP